MKRIDKLLWWICGGVIVASSLRGTKQSLLHSTKGLLRASQWRGSSSQWQSWAITAQQAISIFKNFNYNTWQILDVREDSEYVIWHLPYQTIHIRFSDIFAWDRKKIDPAKKTFVICAQSIRWEVMTKFLRSKWIDAYFIIGWHMVYNRDFHWSWSGSWEYWDVYNQKRYMYPMPQSIFEKYRKDPSIIFIDTSEPKDLPYTLEPDKPSDRIATLNPKPFYFTPIYRTKAQIALWLAQLPPPPARVITLHASYLSTFDAVNAGILLEKQGYEFVGFYGEY